MTHVPGTENHRRWFACGLSVNSPPRCTRTATACQSQPNPRSIRPKLTWLTTATPAACISTQSSSRKTPVIFPVLSLDRAPCGPIDTARRCSRVTPSLGRKPIRKAPARSGASGSVLRDPKQFWLIDFKRHNASQKSSRKAFHERIDRVRASPGVVLYDAGRSSPGCLRT